MVNKFQIFRNLFTGPVSDVRSFDPLCKDFCSLHNLSGLVGTGGLIRIDASGSGHHHRRLRPGVSDVFRQKLFGANAFRRRQRFDNDALNNDVSRDVATV